MGGGGGRQWPHAKWYCSPFRNETSILNVAFLLPRASYRRNLLCISVRRRHQHHHNHCRYHLAVHVFKVPVTHVIVNVNLLHSFSSQEKYKCRGNTVLPVVNAVMSLMYFDLTYLIIKCAVLIMHTAYSNMKKTCIVLHSEFNIWANSEKKIVCYLPK